MEFLRKPRKTILDLPLAAFVGVFVLSSIFSSDKSASVFGGYGRWHEGLLMLFGFFFLSRFLFERLTLPISFPFLETGWKRWIIFSFPLALFVFLSFWGYSSTLSFSESMNIVFHTLFENPKNFLLGSGPGTLFIDTALYSPLNASSQAPWMLEILATMGLLGFIAFIGIVVVFSFSTLVLFERKRARLLPTFAFGAMMVLFLSSLLFPSSLLLFCIFWVLVTFGLLLLKGTRFYSLSRAGRVAITFASFFLISGIVLGFAMTLMGSWKYQEASASLNEHQIVFLKAARRFQPFEPLYESELALAYLTQFAQEIQKPAREQNSVLLKDTISAALDAAKEAVALAPNRFEAWKTLGYIYKEIVAAPGASDWVVKSFEKAVSLQPSNPQFRVELGKAYETKGETKKAREQFEQALRQDPLFVPATREMALLAEKEGNTTEAVRLLEALVNRSPDEESTFQLGRMYYNQKQYDKAIMQLERALQERPANSNARYALALSWEGIGDNKRAVQELEKVLQLNPDNDQVQKTLDQLRQ